MTKVLHGKIRGRTIELVEDLGLSEGQDIEVSVRPASSKPGPKTGDGFLRTEGALADDPRWDAIMEAIHQERKKDTR